MRRARFSITLRLVAAGAALSLVVVGTVLVLVYLWSIDAVKQEMRASIQTEISELIQRQHQGGTDALVVEVQRRSDGRQGTGRYYLLERSGGSGLTGNLKAWPQELWNEHSASFDLAELGPGGSVLRTVHAETITLDDGNRLLVGQDATQQEVYGRRLKLALSGLVVLIVLLAMSSGLAVGARLLRRVNLMNRTVLAILSGSAEHRVPVGGGNDEFEQLARHFNELLDQNDRLVVRVREVSNNIAHDLRTPLTRLRSRIEAALRATRNAEQDAVTLERTLEETDSVLCTFSALLRIAQVEDGTLREEMKEVDLAALVEDAVDLYDPVAEEAGMSLKSSVQPNLTVRGERHLISQALSNLIDNALKYASASTTVGVSARLGAGCVELSVSDEGPGIAEAERKRVLQRFVRLESSPPRPGSGLGLSFVKAVSDLHRARLTLGDNAPGLIVTISFPLPPAPAGLETGS
ncbi:MAG: ATP-binding protein [Planctomycetota bacterium]